jgi:hypothetical protein
VRRSLALAAAALIAAAATAPTAALAHQGNPNMKSVVDALKPHPKGIALQVLGGDDRFQLTNRSRETVLVEGYEDEPYARIAPDGTVSVNHHSPAFYLNTDRYGAVEVPRTATAKAAPDWQVLDRTGVFEWHDHRMHWMAKTVPGVVKDRSVKTKVSNYDIPIRFGATQAHILGTVWWDPAPDGGPPVGAIVALVVLVLGGAGAVVVVRRRRGGSGGADADGDDGAGGGSAPVAAAAPGRGEAW